MTTPAPKVRRTVRSTGQDQTGVSLWRRIADEIEREISDGTHPAGARLPGETEIAARFGVNRHTVRRAIAALAERNLVQAARGSGTYVSERRIAYPIGSRTRFSEIVGSGGLSADGRMIESGLDAADETLAARLGIPKGTPLVRISALRRAGRVPICVGTSWLSAARFPGADKVFASVRSMTRTLEHFGVGDYRRHSTRITAGSADASDAASLDLIPGRTVLIVESVDVDATRRPVLATRARFAADRVEFVVQGGVG